MSEKANIAIQNVKQAMTLSAARTVGKAYVALIDGKHRLFGTLEGARSAAAGKVIA